jgi:hypothetical protein
MRNKVKRAAKEGKTTVPKKTNTLQIIQARLH